MTAPKRFYRWANWRSVAFILCGLLISVITLAVALWFGSSGTGKHSDSPDGRYIAHAYNMSRGTVFRGQERYIELRVVEATTGREVWRAEYSH